MNRIFVVTLALSMMLPFMANSQPHQEPSQQPAKSALQIFKEATKNGLPAALQEQMKGFETSYPRTVNTFKAGNIPVDVMRPLWRGFVSKDARFLRMLSKYEAHGKWATLITSVRAQGSIHAMDDSSDCTRRCNQDADLYYSGCMEFGDPLSCFVLTEFFVCICYASSCNFPNTCTQS